MLVEGTRKQFLPLLPCHLGKWFPLPVLPFSGFFFCRWTQKPIATITSMYIIIFWIGRWASRDRLHIYSLGWLCCFWLNSLLPCLPFTTFPSRSSSSQFASNSIWPPARWFVATGDACSGRLAHYMIAHRPHKHICTTTHKESRQKACSC